MECVICIRRGKWERASLRVCRNIAVPSSSESCFKVSFKVPDAQNHKTIRKFEHFTDNDQLYLLPPSINFAIVVTFQWNKIKNNGKLAEQRSYFERTKVISILWILFFFCSHHARLFSPLNRFNIFTTRTKLKLIIAFLNNALNFT